VRACRVARRAFAPGSLTRRAAAWTFAFILIEGALGAGLVLLELVESNASAWRALAVALHLVNTFILLGWAVLTAWSSSAGVVRRRESATGRLLIAGLAGIALVSAAGAVTALGDTLFLVGTLGRQLGEENLTRYFLVQLRIIHPILAVALALFLVRVGAKALDHDAPRVRRLALAVLAIVALQTALGITTIVMRAPLAMQVGHLLLADLLGLALLVLTFEVLSRAPEPAPETALQAA